MIVYDFFSSPNTVLQGVSHWNVSFKINEFKMQDDSEVLCSDFLVLRNFCSLIDLSSLCNLTGLSSLIFSKTSWSWWFDHQWHQNDQCRFFFVEWIIKNLNFHWYTGCPIDMLTTSDPILQFLKPHILKSKTCFKKFVKKAFRWHLETQQNQIELKYFQI